MNNRNKALIHQLNSVDIRLLRVFRTVADCGGFAASEFELNIGRSTISRHISDLETRIGLKLCNRGPGGFSLSREGERVLDATNKLIEALNTFQGDVDNIHQNLRGTLRFAFFDIAASNPHANLQKAISQFARKAPEVDIEIFTVPPNVIEAGVISGRFDLGVVPIHRRSEGLIYHTLYTENMVLYCGKGHPLFKRVVKPAQAKKLSDYRYAGFAFNSPNMHAGQKHGFHLDARVNNEEALKILLLSGGFLGFLPSHVALHHVAHDELAAVSIDTTSYQTSLGAIIRKHPVAGRKTEQFLNCLNVTHTCNKSTSEAETTLT